MAARVVHECSVENYNQVIVLWTGINRLDTAITRELHDTYPGAWEGNPAYSFCTPIEDLVWYHSGGQAGSWTWDSTCPQDIRQIFKTQYLGANTKYLNQISLNAISATQDFLSLRNIEYKMAFIYDIQKTYQKEEHFFGQMSDRTPVYSQIKWDRIQTNNTVYDWAMADQTRLEGDQFHPTRDAMREWILDNFKLDIAV